MIKITMPQAGNSMTDGTIVRWLKAEGQQVTAGEVLLEVETDKAVMEVESPHAGTLRKVLAEEGQTVAVHSVIALIGEAGEDISKPLADAMAENARLAGSGDADAAPAPAPATPAAPPPEATTAPPQPAPAAPPAAAGNVTAILLPQIGNSMEEGTIVAWKVSPGQQVKVGDVLFEMETDKAVVEVEATDAGRLAKIVAGDGETVPVKQPVAYLADSDADVDAHLAAQGSGPGQQQSQPAPPAAATPTSAAAAPSQAAAAQPAVATASGRVKASPAARKQAAVAAVDLAQMPAGRGPAGRILSSDVQAYAQQQPAAAPAPAAGDGQPVRRRLSAMRKAIARNLLASKQNIPHFYMRMSFDAAPMMDFYRSQKALYPCSVNDVVVAAMARAMREFPAFRSRFDADAQEIVEFPGANIGLAVGMDDGLVVPVLMSADAMGLRDLAAQTRGLIERARSGRIENMGQGTITVTNLGMFGVEEFSAIINPPESAILAIGAVREEVIVSGGTFRAGRVMTVTLSADHRIIDGLLAAKFLARLKEILEYPAPLA